eukprot:3680815-Amphidinium_carterae.1
MYGIRCEELFAQLCTRTTAMHCQQQMKPLALQSPPLLSLMSYVQSLGCHIVSPTQMGLDSASVARTLLLLGLNERWWIELGICNIHALGHERGIEETTVDDMVAALATSQRLLVREHEHSIIGSANKRNIGGTG